MAAERQPERAPPPLKRHRALVPLSREHMSGLIQARTLCRASDGDLASRRAAVLAFVETWQSEIEHHFDDEERLLLPLTQNAELAERLLEEHRRLRELAQRCVGAPEEAAREPALLHCLGSLLHDHIRWEERVYFEAIQRDHPEALAALEHEADRIEQHRPGARARRTLEK